MQEQPADRLLARARERFGLQDYHGTLYLLDELIEAGHAYADAHQLRGLALALLGHSERALAAFDAALAINPRYTDALVHRGIVLSDLGRTEEAADSLARPPLRFRTVTPSSRSVRRIPKLATSLRL